MHPAGTIFVLHSGGFVSWAIRLLTRSRVNHAGVCVGDGRTIEAEAAGAIYGVEQADTNGRVRYGRALWYRVDAMAPGRNAAIAAEAKKLLGSPYNYADILALAWESIRHDPSDGVPVKPGRIESRVMNDGRLICSQLADLAALRAGVHLFTDGRLPGQVTPGDLDDVLADPSGVIVD